MSPRQHTRADPVVGGAGEPVDLGAGQCHFPPPLYMPYDGKGGANMSSLPTAAGIRVGPEGMRTNGRASLVLNQGQQSRE